MPLVYEVQVTEALRKIKKLSKSRNKVARELAREVLMRWVKIAEFIDTALINHKFWIITIHISREDKAISLTYVKDKESKEWVLKGIRYGPRVGWGFKWEYDLVKDKPIVRKTIKEEREVKPKNIIA